MTPALSPTSTFRDDLVGWEHDFDRSAVPAQREADCARSAAGGHPEHPTWRRSAPVGLTAASVRNVRAVALRLAVCPSPKTCAPISRLTRSETHRTLRRAARVAELVDALDSESSVRKDVLVRLQSRAPLIR